MMNDRDLDAFFRGRRVAVLAIPHDDGRAPLTTPIWYDWDGSVFRLQVDATSAKAKRIAKLGQAQVSLAIQSEVPPYRYAVVYGTATLGAGGGPPPPLPGPRALFGWPGGQPNVPPENTGG